MKKKCRLSIVSIVLLFFILVPLKLVLAETQNTFSMTPLNPDTNQPQSGYYDLIVSPGEAKKLSIRIFNSAAEDLKVNVEASSASTNDNGVTSYLSGQKKDESLKVDFSEIAKVDENPVVVPGYGSIDVGIEVLLPDEPFEGVVLGGIRITSADEKADDGEKKAAVTSNIAYSVGVVLRESTEELAPEIKLINVGTEQRNYRNYIYANIQNAAPRIIKKLEVDAKVYKKGSKKLLYEASNVNMRMAPNSNFNYGINLQDQPFKAGNYTMELSGSADGEAFSFTRDFEITTKEAREFNKNAVYVEKSENVILLVIIGVVLLAMVVLLMIYIIRNKMQLKNARED